MNFDTKFGIGDIAWLMYLNKPIQATITAISIHYTETSGTKVKYSLKDIDTASVHFKDESRPANQLFESKEELLSSL